MLPRLRQRGGWEGVQVGAQGMAGDAVQGRCHQTLLSYMLQRLVTMMSIIGSFCQPQLLAL